MFKSIRFLFVAIAAMAVLISCTALVPKTTGSLEIRVTDGAGLRQMLPPAGSMVIDHYEYWIYRQVGHVLADTGTFTTSKTINYLTPGVYCINVQGDNASGQGIGDNGVDGNNVPVVIGEVAVANITVTEFVGPGELNIAVDWPVGSVNSPTWLAKMGTSIAGLADNTPDWTVTANTRNYNNTNLANGWYIVTGVLSDPNGQIAGFADVARIAKGRLTSGVVHLVPNATTGGLQILIQLDFHDELVMNRGAVTETTINLNDTSDDRQTTVTGAEVYAWYKNGVAFQSVNGSFNFAKGDFAIGTYNIDVVGFTIDGKRAGHLNWVVNRTH